MDIKKVFEAVQTTINDFQKEFPNLITLVDIKKWENETIDVIRSYKIKYSLIDKASLEKELTTYLNSAQEVFNIGFDSKEDDELKAQNILVGLLEMRWITVFLNEIESGISDIYENHDLAYFTEERNIPNQKLVKETLEYFEKGEGSRAFKSLDFLNLLEKQYKYIEQNIDQREKVIVHLQQLPLNELQQHILFGFLIKWYGGYPISEPSGYGKSIAYHQVFKDLLALFLEYPSDTPEKEFCKADNELRRKGMKLGIALTTAINNNIDPVHIYNEMEQKPTQIKGYSSFDELFEDAVRNNTINNIQSQEPFKIERSRYNYEFNVWLQETLGWEFGNETRYKAFLNKETFIEFLKYQKVVLQQKLIELENEKKSWNVEDRQDGLNNQFNASHREIIIAHNLKYKAGLVEDKTPGEWKEERGEKARQSYYTTLPQSENYKKPSIKELSNVIKLLTDFPSAQKMAINIKAELESL